MSLGQASSVNSSVAGSSEGYTMRESLHALHDRLSQELDRIISAMSTTGTRTRWSYLRVFHPAYEKSPFHWTSIIFMLFLVSSLLIAYFVPRSDTPDIIKPDTWLLIEGLFIFLMLIVNISLLVIESTLEQDEHIRLIRLLLIKIKECARITAWNPSNFPNANSPISPCVSLNWTVRDGEIINIPTVLLVEGDIILLRPNQEAPAKCQRLGDNDDILDTVLRSGEVFIRSGTPESTVNFTEPQTRQPEQACRFVLLETPFVENMRHILLSSQCRPVSLMDNERYHVGSVWVERRVVPVIFVLLLLINVLHYIYMRDSSGHWADTIIVMQVHTLLPLAPLLFPALWILLNHWGLARLLVATINAERNMVLHVSEDSFDTDSRISADEARVTLTWSQVAYWFKLVLTGTTSVVTRSANIMQTMASVTSFCCVDKKGVLSWPNPTAEKIFFPTSQRTSHNSKVLSNHKPMPHQSNKAIHADHHFEVLDLSHDAKSSFGLQFDDPTWKLHINSLKPLGLNILVNTCNQDMFTWYTRFTDHIACTAMKNDETVAVVNRRCLCELAHQIGFSDRVLDIYSLEQINGIYKQVPAEQAAKERLYQAKSFIQHKIPMPNMVSMVIREKTTGMYQLMSQGTADILLDSCIEYWDGQKLCLLTDTERKKILDFYHRTSMGAYCTAFAYQPLTLEVTPRLQTEYVELPEHMSALPSSLSRTSDLSSSYETITSPLRAFSLDSLLGDGSLCGIDNDLCCHQVHNEQIFMGLVTMQYQARQDTVQLVQKLDSACIRFVHFSQENELRSRIFSEKMGLEAGWNCHVSLRSSSKEDIDILSDIDMSQRTSKYSSNHSANHSLTQHSSEYVYTKQKCHSAPPSMVNLHKTAQVSTVSANLKDEKTEPALSSNFLHAGQVMHPLTAEAALNSMSASVTVDGGDDDICEMGEVEVLLTDYYSESYHTSSYAQNMENDSLTGMLDNLAKLPRGIENIQPHLEHVDNVPLLVNLFTDCTAETTTEMIRIMQKYGEVVLSLGSSVNIHNTPTFIQANASIGIEPLYPQSCARHPAIMDLWEESMTTPMQLVASMLSLPCSLSLQREDNISFIQLIAQARNFVQTLRNAFQLMLCCQFSLCILQVLSSLFLLPPVLSSRHLLWLIVIVCPSLSLSLINTEVNPNIMTWATGKNLNPLTLHIVIQFLLFNGSRFLPSIIVILICFGVNVKHLCSRATLQSSVSYSSLSSPSVLSINDTDCSSFTLYRSVDGTVWNAWSVENTGYLCLIQNILLYQIVAYFVTASAGFVHKYEHIWVMWPYTNKIWLVTSILLLLSQLIYAICDISKWGRDSEALDLSIIHPAVWSVAVIWPVILLAINELIKMREIKLWVRFQKGSRLSFGTKLGMNSPF